MTELSLFGLGDIVATAAFSDHITANGISPIEILLRHMTGDWGEVCQEDKDANDWAMVNDARIISVYTVASVKCYVITEWDRSVTTMLLVSDY